MESCELVHSLDRLLEQQSTVSMTAIFMYTRAGGRGESAR